jgi:phosphoglycerate dehydrogenase-like enzyme
VTAQALQRRKVIVDPHFRRMAEIFSAADAERLTKLVEVVWGRDDPMPLEGFEAAIPEAMAVVSAGWRYGSVLDRAEELRAILTVGGGWPPEIDYPDCQQRGIRVLSAAPAFAPAVAEMALGLALACCRDLVAEDRAMRAGVERFLSDAGTLDTFHLFGQRVGFVGFGNIGRQLRRLLEPFRCDVLAHDPWLTDAYLREEGVQPSSLRTLLQTSRFVFVLASPSSENEALLSRDLLELVSPDTVLVLVSRAHVVDFAALTDLVLAGRFRAGIDVYPSEPLSADHPIRGAAGAVLSPHRAGLTKDALWDIGRRVVDDLEAIVTGLPPHRLQVADPELASRYVRTTTVTTR